MTIYLYKINSSFNTLNKKLNDGYKITGQLKNDINLTDLYIVLSLDNIFLQKYNYCFIKELNRYYFIKDIKILNNGFTTMYLSLDVLYTYSDKLLNSHFNVTSANNLNNPINVITSNKQIIKQYHFNEISFKNNSIMVMSSII